MNLVAKNIDVDAGMIMVADMDYLNNVPKADNPADCGAVFKVKNGIYTVKWAINNTWNGEIEGIETIKVTSGKIFVSDPCYVITDDHGEWLEWLDETDFGKDLKVDNAFIINEMGGDGSYKVELELS